MAMAGATVSNVYDETDHTSDIFSVASTADIVAILSHAGADSSGNAILTPALIVLGSVDRGSREAFLIDRAGQTYFSALNLAFPSAPRWIRNGQLMLNASGKLEQQTMASAPTEDMHIATKKYVDDKECILQSTTLGSVKKFKITVDDSGALSAVEVTE